MTIIAAADGSSLGNPGPAGWAWFIDEERWAAGGWPSATNNIGELTAVAELLESTAGVGEPLRILCDSQYVINSVTKWMPGWKRKGWRKSDGKPVLNRALLERIDAALPGREVTFEWVKGHAGHDLNEAADARARGAATAFAERREPDAGPGFPRSAGTGVPGTGEGAAAGGFRPDGNGTPGRGGDPRAGRSGARGAGVPAAADPGAGSPDGNGTPGRGGDPRAGRSGARGAGVPAATDPGAGGVRPDGNGSPGRGGDPRAGRSRAREAGVPAATDPGAEASASSGATGGTAARESSPPTLF